MSQNETKNYNIRTGSPLKLSFQEAAGAGYLWSCQADDGLNIQSSTFLNGDRAAVGAPVTREFTISARTPGRYELEFTHKRPWEDKAAETKTVILNVKP